jgi:hypothetical protein
MLNTMRHSEATWILGFLFLTLALLLNSLGLYEGCLILNRLFYSHVQSTDNKKRRYD